MGKLCIELDQDRQYFQDIIIGLRKVIWNGNFKDNADREFCNYAARKLQATFDNSSYYVAYHYTTPRSLSESDYFSGLKLLFRPDDDPITPIINELKKFKDLEKEIEELARKAQY